MKKIVFLVTEDWYFYSHRLPIARAARNAGYTVVVATHVAEHGELIIREGFELIPLESFKRARANPWQIVKEIFDVTKVYRKERPNLVHHVALKPVVVGSIAARIAGVSLVVNAVAGMGFVFSSHKLRARLVRPLLKYLLRFCFKNSAVIVQNPDDKKGMIKQGLVHEEQVRLIRGSGVDIRQFHPMQEPYGIFSVALVSRMLWDKGIGEFVSAIQLLRSKGIQIRALLVGVPDSANPNSIPEDQLKRWHEEGKVEWLGHIKDICSVWRQAHVAVLPSYYREGVPKCLLEAAACARPIVTTDMPGCREIVSDGETGLLVAPRNVEELSQAIYKLYHDAEMRRRMGVNARTLVESTMSEGIVSDATMKVYIELLARR